MFPHSDANAWECGLRPGSATNSQTLKRENVTLAIPEVCWGDNMVRPLRIEYRGAIYHVTARGMSVAVSSEQKKQKEILPLGSIATRETEKSH